MLSRLRGLVQNRPKDRPQMPVTSGQALLWDDLHDYALLQILEHLAISDLVRLEAVNRRLHHLVRRIINGRHHLLLIIGYQYGEYEPYQKNVIILSSLSVATVEQLLRLLPNLTLLWLVVTVEINDLQPFTLLLGRLSTQLTKLRLDFKAAQLPPNLSLSPLIPLINSMIHLRSLNCFFERLSTPEEEPRHLLQLPVIRHLDVLDCNIWQYGDLIYQEVITQMAATIRETPPLVYLPVSIRGPATIDQLLHTAPQIAQRFRSLGLHTLDELTATQWNVICERFCNLEHINLASPYLTTRQLATALVKLPQLTSLTWFTHFSIRQRDRENAFFFEEQIESDEVVEEETLPQLTTVETVNLLLHIVRHEDLALLHLKRLFPSVSTMDIWIRSCDQCGILMEDEEGTKRRKRCLLKTAIYWRDLPKLEEVTTVAMDIDEAEWRSMEGVRSGRLCDSRLCKAFKGIYKKLASWIGGGCLGGRPH